MVVTALTNLPHLVLDIDEFPRLAEKHDVKAVPTFAMLAPNGTAVARATGYRAAGPFLEWLTNSTTEVAAAVARQKQMEERFVALDRLLAAPDPETARKTARELFDLCAEKDDGVRKAATTSLQRLAGRDAVLLLDGLNHPRLATRIEVANLLRARLGETFAVDPWGDSLAREKGIAHWREKLALKPDLEKSP
jgi:thioredoxin-like negative regulator of GroEL